MINYFHRDLIENRFRPSDFIKQKLPIDAKTKIDPGTRLDMEFELKSNNLLDNKTRNMNDQMLLNKYYDLKLKNLLFSKPKWLKKGYKTKQGYPSIPDPGLDNFIDLLKKNGINVTGKNMDIYPVNGTNRVGEIDVITKKLFNTI